jgi:hypothetical protein
MAMFCAAMLLVCPDIEISVFATGQRIAGKLLKLISKVRRRGCRVLFLSVTVPPSDDPPLDYVRGCGRVQVGPGE